MNYVTNWSVPQSEVNNYRWCVLCMVKSKKMNKNMYNSELCQVSQPLPSNRYDKKHLLTHQSKPLM